jgi:hypothetical protein
MKSHGLPLGVGFSGLELHEFTMEAAIADKKISPAS